MRPTGGASGAGNRGRVAGTVGGRVASADGSKLISTSRGPATFFDPAYARDFITMSAR